MPIFGTTRETKRSPCPATSPCKYLWLRGPATVNTDGPLRGGRVSREKDSRITANTCSPVYVCGGSVYVVVRRTLVARGPFAPPSPTRPDAVALAQHVDALTVNAAGMKEHLFARGILNKAESFVCAECFDGSYHSLTSSCNGGLEGGLSRGPATKYRPHCTSSRHEPSNIWSATHFLSDRTRSHL